MPWTRAHEAPRGRSRCGLSWAGSGAATRAERVHFIARLGGGLALAASCIAFAGCGSKNPVGSSPAATARTWIGTYVTATGHGPIVIDAVQTGRTLAGEVVLGSSNGHFYLTGRVRGDSIQLALDPTRGYAFTLEIAGRVEPDSQLVGRMSSSLIAVVGTIACRPLAHRVAIEDLTLDVPFDVKAIQFDGAQLWLSTVGDDYVRMTTAGIATDAVAIFYRPDAHWTSAALAYDGAKLWGFLPGSINGPAGSQDYAEVLAFTAAGRTGDSLRILQRPGGLAFDGANLWTLNGGAHKIYRFDYAGTLTDSINVEIPDPYHLDYAAGRFWTVGWYMKRLYEFDAHGALWICDLPGQATGSLQGGLALEGNHVWTVEDHLGYSTLHRLTVQ